jgi:hypothetical protein
MDMSVQLHAGAALTLEEEHLSGEASSVSEYKMKQQQSQQQQQQQ